jgi:hypothetical protein
VDILRTTKNTEEEGHVQDQQTIDSIDGAQIDTEFSDGDQKEIDWTKAMKMEAAPGSVTKTGVI